MARASRALPAAPEADGSMASSDSMSDVMGVYSS